MKYLCVLLFFMSCKAQKEASSKVNESKNADTNLVLIASENYSGQSLPEMLIIKEPKALEKFFSKVNRTRKPGLAVPKIDFEKETIVIYCLGEQTRPLTPVIEIEKETEDQIILRALSQKTSSSGQTQEITTSPFCMYTVATADKTILFSTTN